MEQEDVRPCGLSSLRDGAAEASPPKASIPDAAVEAIAQTLMSVDGAPCDLAYEIGDALWREGFVIAPSRATKAMCSFGYIVSEHMAFINDEEVYKELGFIYATMIEQAMEARRAETETGSVHDSAVTK